MKNVVLGGSVVAAIHLSGCASTKMSVEPPRTPVETTRSITIDKPKDEVWDKAVSNLGLRFFVINNLEKSSGLINVSYNGDPSAYVDCGSFTVETQIGAQKNSQLIQGNAPLTNYQVTVSVPPYGVGQLMPVQRRMALEGRVNVIFEAIEPNKTKITTATRYILTRTFISGAGSSVDTATFNGNEIGTFPPANAAGDALQCVANGALEKSILDAVN